MKSEYQIPDVCANCGSLNILFATHSTKEVKICRICQSSNIVKGFEVALNQSIQKNKDLQMRIADLESKLCDLDAFTDTLIEQIAHYESS
jgi:hypothetical protein